MTRILLVDNDQMWLDLIAGSLPEYDVDKARSYDEALLAIRDGAYDVAIVDLNLIDSPDHYTGDFLGGKVLDKLRDDYPSTRRIALTAYPPGAVRKEVMNKYAVDDLLLKGNMSLAVVGEVVRAALGHSSAELGLGVRSQRSGLRDDFDRWQEVRGWRFDQRLQSLRNDLLSPPRRPGQGDASQAVSELRDRLAALEHWRKDFDHECSEVSAIMDRMRTAEDVLAAQRKIGSLKQRFDTDDDGGAR